MALTIIVAHDKNRGIGFKSQIPWYISEDFKWFKENTFGKIVVMGTTTYFSLPKKTRPLPNRINYVLCNEKNKHLSIIKEGGHILTSINDVLDISTLNDVFIIGGASIYQQFIDKVDNLIITEINKSFECDTFFPEYKTNGWKLVYKSKEYNHEDYIYTFNKYTR